MTKKYKYIKKRFSAVCTYWADGAIRDYFGPELSYKAFTKDEWTKAFIKKFKAFRPQVSKKSRKRKAAYTWSWQKKHGHFVEVL